MQYNHLPSDWPRPMKYPLVFELYSFRRSRASLLLINVKSKLYIDMINFSVLFLALLTIQCNVVRFVSASHVSNATQYAPKLPFDPRPAPPYMVDNQHNFYNTAPDKGKHNGPVWAYSGSMDRYMTNLRNGTVMRGGYAGLSGIKSTTFSLSKTKRQASSDAYWLSTLGPMGATRPRR
ncbi:hypothetical protein F5Y07DRAFT_260526 [Xylaria sp. FL0933]|nr:hypothetical protein F5Y07DRAFT_260526 [Xylaria sp. FL0933]